MMPLILPLAQRLRSRMGLSKTIHDVAAEIVTIAPEETAERHAAISLPAQLDRVRAVQAETTPDFEHARITSGMARHAPTTAFMFRNAWYLNGVLYAGGARQSQVWGREPLINFGKPKKMAQAALPSSFVGSRYFGHHVVDDSVTTLLAAQFAPTFRAPAPAVEAWPHAGAYRARMGVDTPVLKSAYVTEAWLFDDWGMTAHRRQRLIQLREKLRDAQPSRMGHGVFLRRRGAGAVRNLINEAEIEGALAKLGFDIVDLATDHTDAIIARCQGAGVIVGVEGSGLAHGLLSCAKDAAFLVLQHPYRFNNVWKDFTDALDLRYAFLVGEGNPEAFRIDPDELLATLDLL